MSIEELRVYCNKLTLIPDLSSFNLLYDLDVSDNQIEKVDGLPKQIQKLYIGGNRIQSIDWLKNYT